MKTLLVALAFGASLGPAAPPTHTMMPYPPCQGGEVGYWQPLKSTPGKMGLVLTEHEDSDGQDVLCFVPVDAKVMVLKEDAKL